MPRFNKQYITKGMVYDMTWNFSKPVDEVVIQETEEKLVNPCPSHKPGLSHVSK